MVSLANPASKNPKHNQKEKQDGGTLSKSTQLWSQHAKRCSSLSVPPLSNATFLNFPGWAYYFLSASVRLPIYTQEEKAQSHHFYKCIFRVSPDMYIGDNFIVEGIPGVFRPVGTCMTVHKSWEDTSGLCAVQHATFTTGFRGINDSYIKMFLTGITMNG
jgi:hypothetical protein